MDNNTQNYLGKNTIKKKSDLKNLLHLGTHIKGDRTPGDQGKLRRKIGIGGETSRKEKRGPEPKDVRKIRWPGGTTCDEKNGRRHDKRLTQKGEGRSKRMTTEQMVR